MLQKFILILKKIIYSILIVFFSIISLEICLKVYSKANNISIINDNRNSKLVKVYTEGKIFKTNIDFFTYEKNLKKKRYINYYYERNSLKKIWDYEFSTNNYGLVQKDNIFKNKKSILFLGDSFTEGLGSKPWLDKFSGSIKNLQIINGGFQGTGFKQFAAFEKYISKIMNIEHVVILYIGSDIRRGTLKLDNSPCLINFNNCIADNGHFGVPQNPDFDIEKNLKNILKNRKKLYLEERTKNLLRNTYIYSYLRSTMNNFRLRNDNTIEKNLNAIIELKKKYKNNVTFIRINTAEEIAFKKKSFETEFVDNFLKKNNIKNYFCNMEQNLKMFHKIDFHPNKDGYAHLFNCVNDILNDELL